VGKMHTSKYYQGLNLISNNLKVVKVIVSDDDIVEVTILDEWNNLNHFYFIFALFFAFHVCMVVTSDGDIAEVTILDNP
jgi:hypothetical protein